MVWQLTLDADDWTAVGADPSNGYLELSFLHPLLGSPVTTNRAWEARLVDGEGSWDIPAIPADNALVVRSRVQGLYLGRTFWFADPGVGAHSLSEMISGKQVDPKTLEPSEEALTGWLGAVSTTAANAAAASTAAIAAEGQASQASIAREQSYEFANEAAVSASNAEQARLGALGYRTEALDARDDARVSRDSAAQSATEAAASAAAATAWGEGGGGVTSYNDLADKPTIPATPADIGAQPAGDYATNSALTSGLAAKQASGDYATNAAVSAASTADRARTNHTGTQAASTITGLAAVATSGAYTDLTGTPDITAATAGKLDTSAAPELIRDTIGTALVAGTGVTITPDDAGDTITIASTGGGGTANGLSSNELILAKIDRALRSKVRPLQGIALELNGTSYYLWQRLSPGQWLRAQMDVRTNTNGGNVLIINQYVMVTPSILVAAGDGTITETGAFTTSGSYRYSVTAGNTMAYTSPASTTRVGAAAGKFTNGGLSKVTINGDPQRARLLPTAQDLVERGLYPATILTTSGGTLLATDRVIDHYGVGRQEYVLFADDLPPAAHAVIITTTGYQRTASTGARTYISGFLHGQAQVIGTSGTTNYTTFAWDGGAGGSATEYAISAKPSGGSFTFMGCIHDNEAQDSLTVAVDGVAPTLTSAVPVFPTQNAAITRTSHLIHPTAGTCANITTIITLERDGITVDVTVTWTQAMIVNACYAMLPLNGATQAVGSTPRPNFDRGDLLEYGSGPMRFTGDGANPYLGRSKSAAAWMWSSQQRFAAGLYIEDIATYANNWVNSGDIYSCIQDRAGTITKAYLTRVGAVNAAQYENVSAGTQWKWRAHYLFGAMDSPERVFAS